VIKKTEGGKYQVRIYSLGKQVGMRTFDKKRDASLWEAEEKRKLVAGQWTDARLGNVSLGSIIDSFNEARLGTISRHAYDTDEANLRLHVPESVKKRPVNSIDVAVIEDLLAEVVRKRKRATASRVRDTLVALFKYAKSRKIATSNPAQEAILAKGTGQEVDKVRPFAPAQLSALIDHARIINAGYANLIEFASLTGLRWGELVELRVRDIRTAPLPLVNVERSKSDAYEVGATKSRKSRRVPLIDRASALIAEQITGKDEDELVFQAPRGGRVNGGNFRRQLDWNTSASGHRPHDLRHTAATSWIADGLDVKTVSVWLGHSSSAITHRVYAGWLGADSDIAAMAKLRAAVADRALTVDGEQP
jgi:integrase